MAKSKRAPACPDESWSQRQRDRVRVLETLLAICRQFERLQASIEARRACADIAGLLNTALIREQINAGLRRK